MNTAYLSLGSNIGDREAQLRQAICLLNRHPEVATIQLSSIYETAPVGYTDQEPFLNLVARVETELTAFGLLDLCQSIEQALHRERLIRWGPRTVDLDILLYNHDNMESERLTIPHPRMEERAFVLIPLSELDSTRSIPEGVENQGVLLWKTYASTDAFMRAADLQ